MGREYGGATMHGGNSPAAPRAEAADLIDRLERLIGEHRMSLNEPGRSVRDIADVKAEFDESEPDKARVLDALRRIAGRDGEVTEIVKAVERIRDLL